MDTGPMDAEQYRRIWEEVHRGLSVRLEDLHDPFAEERMRQAAAGPPQSYKDARKKVEQFILKADPTSFDDIVGNAEALETLIDAIQAPVKYKELYKAYGMKMPKGALLSGPPGCGKTMFARAAASEFIKLYGKEVEFISIQATDIQSTFVGATEAHIRNIFKFGREYMAYKGHPLLVFMDEAEIMFPDRTGRQRRVFPWEESQVATFLAEMDGIRESCVFMLLATNRPEAIDSALLRDGRCDFKIVVKRPTKESAETILNKAFTHTLAGENQDTLIMAALESFYSPHHIIAEADSIIADLEKRKVKQGLSRHFLLEDIVSGAMLVSIPTRATRHAFARDKKEGVAKGVTVPDVIRAVTDIFEENKRLDHPFARQEFMEKFIKDLEKDIEND
jgi:SpoVK/Ycf46/Vps4 family AAA+-type ATPase